MCSSTERLAGIIHDRSCGGGARVARRGQGMGLCVRPFLASAVRRGIPNRMDCGLMLAGRERRNRPIPCPRRTTRASNAGVHEHIGLACQQARESTDS